MQNSIREANIISEECAREELLKIDDRDKEKLFNFFDLYCTTYNFIKFLQIIQDKREVKLYKEKTSYLLEAEDEKTIKLYSDLILLLKNNARQKYNIVVEMQ